MNDIIKAIILLGYMLDIEKNNLRYARTEDTKKYHNNNIESLNLAIKTLEKQLTNSWIPVSERLPNDEECNKFDLMHPNHRKFICTIKIADYEPQTRELYFSEIFGWKYGPEDYNKYVIAWMSIPESYKEVKCGEIN